MWLWLLLLLLLLFYIFFIWTRDSGHWYWWCSSSACSGLTFSEAPEHWPCLPASPKPSEKKAKTPLGLARHVRRGCFVKVGLLCLIMMRTMTMMMMMTMVMMRAPLPPSVLSQAVFLLLIPVSPWGPHWLFLPSVDPCVPLRSTLAVSSSFLELVRMFETGERTSESFFLTMFHDFVTMTIFMFLWHLWIHHKNTQHCVR